jgi:CRISPR-associated endonuclease/helicase Cas3
MPDDQSIFRASFHALTGHRPFPWQERLFEAFKRGDIPRSVALPTATGKTSLMPIWVIALGWQARQASAHVSLPRRLIWVVNRRGVVDQATEEAAQLTERITHPERAAAEEQPVLQSLRATLARLSILGELGESPLAVSTLRGELADNGEWKLDPSRPAIIIGTVDMIGSRLLFSGYGDGLWKRPHHAGLLGQDALIVHDEAHLTPAFGALLEGIQEAQTRYGSGPKPFAAIQLSATLQAPDVGAFGLAEDDLQDEALKPRLRAEKWLRLHALERGRALEDRLAALALAHQGQGVRVVVYVQSPQTAMRVAAKLRNAAPDHVAVLTGTLRGYERDRLLEDPVFQRFLPGLDQAGAQETSYLVSTSAGEVGINLDADHMVGEFPTADHLIQQLGRVQRFGRGRADIDLVMPASDGPTGSKRTTPQAQDDPLLATHRYLRSLPGDGTGRYDVSLQTLQDHPPPPEAFSPLPKMAPLLPHWLDMWSLTSIRERDWPERPPVERWLHGQQPDLPETYVVWREEARWLASEGVSRSDCEAAFEVSPILTQERLRETTRRVQDALIKMAARYPTTRTVLLRPDGSAWRGGLAAAAREPLAYTTVVLPVEVGGLKAGLLDSAAADTVIDVADAGAMMPQARYLVTQTDTVWTARRLGRDEGEAPLPPQDSIAQAAVALAHLRGLRVLAVIPLHAQAADDEEPEEELWLVYLGSPRAAFGTRAVSFVAPQRELLEEHLPRVGATAQHLSEQLELPTWLMESEKRAGHEHDRGKHRPWWQRAIGNFEVERPLAKSGHAGFNHKLNGGYRHELGSLLEVEADAELGDALQRDLVLHLIATHHGWGRPHFLARAYDQRYGLIRNREAAHATVQRFARLQKRFGWWGLAYLEAVLKAADGLVSSGIGQGRMP